MTNSNSKVPLILSIIVIIFISTVTLISFFVLDEESFPMLKIIPGNGMMQEISMIFLLSVVFSSLSVLLFGKIVSTLILKGQKKFFGKDLEYYLQDIPKPKRFSLSWRGLLPALLAINIALIFASNETAINIIMTPQALAEMALQGDELGPMIWTFLALLPYASLVSIGIFVPAWAVIELGIVYSDIKKVRNKPQPMQVNNVGGYVYGAIKGYTGIGTVVSFYIFIMKFIIDTATYNSPGGLISAIIELPLLPFMLYLFFIPAYYLNGVVRYRRNDRLLKVAKRLEMTGKFEDLIKLD